MSSLRRQSFRLTFPSHPAWGWEERQAKRLLGPYPVLQMSKHWTDTLRTDMHLTVKCYYRFCHSRDERNPWWIHPIGRWKKANLRRRQYNNKKSDDNSRVLQFPFENKCKVNKNQASMANRLHQNIKINYKAFLDSSVGKESACNAGDPGSNPGLGRSSEEGMGDPFQSSWASLVAQLVKNLPAMWVWSLGWEDSPGEGKGYPPQYSGLENSTDCIVHGDAKNKSRLSDSRRNVTAEIQVGENDTWHLQIVLSICCWE